MSTLRQLLSWGSETLEKAEVPDSGQDAWMLMEEVFGIEKSYYFLHGTDKIDPDVTAGVRQDVLGGPHQPESKRGAQNADHHEDCPAKN